MHSKFVIQVEESSAPGSKDCGVSSGIMIEGPQLSSKSVFASDIRRCNTKVIARNSEGSVEKIWGIC